MGVTNASESGKWAGEWEWVSNDELESRGVIANGNLTAQYDAAVQNWGNGWRMPTKEEIKELANLDNESAEINGVKGWKFIGTNGNFLFLPIAGYFGSRGYDEDYGIYLSSSNSTASSALYIENGKVFCDNYSRNDKYTIRPVRKR